MANPEQEYEKNKSEEQEQSVVDQTIKSKLVDNPEMLNDFAALKDSQMDNKALYDDFELEQKIYEDDEYM